MQAADAKDRRAALAVALLLWLSGCAQGVGESNDIPSVPPGQLGLGSTAAPVAGAVAPVAGGVAPVAGATAPVAGAAAQMPVVPALDTCTQGDVAPCVCLDTGTEGTKRCLYEPTSPTMGVFSMCENCAPPASAMQLIDAAVPAVCDPLTCPLPAAGTACCTDAGVCGAAMPAQACM